MKSTITTRPAASTIALAVTVALMWTTLPLLAPNQANANLKYRGGAWAFYGKTKNRDPFTILWMGRFNETMKNIRGHVTDHFRRKGSRMKGPRCTGDTAYFRSRSGRRSGPPNLRMSTSSTCKNQYHLRVWNDTLHGHSGRRQWAPATVHREVKDSHLGRHRLTQKFEVSENIFVHEMSQKHEHCTWNDWRRHPGTSVRSKKHYSNGRISRISLEHKDDSTTCR